MIFDNHATFGNTCRAARFKHIDRFVLQLFWHPTSHWTASQPVVLEQRKLLQVVKAVDVLERVKVERLLLFEPKIATGVVAKMPLHHFSGLLIQQILLSLHVLVWGGHGTSFSNGKRNSPTPAPAARR